MSWRALQVRGLKVEVVYPDGLRERGQLADIFGCGRWVILTITDLEQSTDHGRTWHLLEEQSHRRLEWTSYRIWTYRPTIRVTPRWDGTLPSYTLTRV